MRGLSRAPRALILTAAFAATACASAPVVVPPAAPAPPVVSLDQKLSWILRLEQQRSLRDAAATGPAGVCPFGADHRRVDTGSVRPCRRDPDPTVRRRAVVAIGRVGQATGVTLLVTALQDPDVEVRGSAAFALGLIGATDSTASAAEAKAAAEVFPGRTALLSALHDQSARVRGRAIDALGLIGDRSAAAAIYQAAAGCADRLAPLAPDDEEWPKADEIEICRLALFALVRLQDYGALAAVALDASGRPVSSWWPVAYALQRSNDSRAVPALRILASGPGLYTAGFALRGLAAHKVLDAAPIAAGLAFRADADLKLRVAAVRVLGQLGLVKALRSLLDTPALPLNLQVEIITALGAAADPSAFDPLLDWLTHASPVIRSAAIAAAAKINREAFLVVLSGLGRDPEWSVRVALLGVLATLPAGSVTAAIEELVDDEDVRVRGPALEALAAVKAPSLTSRLFAALEAADFVVRATAARLIGEARPEGGVPRLIAAYARGDSDRTYTARWAALEALSKYGGAEAITTLRRGLADREWPVRWRVARLLVGLGQAAEPERPAPLSRPAALLESPELLHPTYSPHAFIDTASGTIEIQVNVVESAVTAHVFMDQVRSGFFNGMKIHRLVPTFVVQAGDPRGDGEGGPGYTTPDELSPVPYLRGTVGMALDWRDTAGSQWFIALSPQPHLDGRYTVFGRVVGGLEVLDRLTQWDVIDRIRIWDGVGFRE